MPSEKIEPFETQLRNATRYQFDLKHL
jgi:hypothetical protein